MPADWNPARYHQFADQRAQSFWDLLALVEPVWFDAAVDLGCGSGELTTAAAARLGVRSMIGIDNSAAMLDAAAPFARDGLAFEPGDIASWTSEHDRDLVTANASLQWVPDHPTVLERWVAALRPGGQLAVQVPANADHASHLASAAVACREPFVSAMGGDPPPDPVAVNVLRPEEYAAVLFDLGAADPHVRLQVYPHLLASSTEVVDWVRGTSLTRFFKLLPNELHEPFVDAYRVELLTRIGDRAPYL